MTSFDPLGCDCPENRATHLSRRSFLKMTALGGLAVATTSSGATVAFGAVTATGTMVVLSLRGGFDGLSCVVPVGDPAYALARPNIQVPVSQTHQLDSTFGLHPAMKPVFDLFDNGTMAAVHAVGQAAPTRSHFEAAAELERAAPDSSLRTGWIDRTLGTISNLGKFTGTQVGSATLPIAMSGPNVKFGMGSIAGVKLAIGEDDVPLSAWRSAVRTLHTGSSPQIAVPTTAALDAITTMRTVQAADSRSARDLSYPDTPFGNALHDVARLIKADVGLRVATLDFGNWDMHTNLGKVDNGWMHDQLSELSTALAAFAAEMGPAGLTRTTLITLSEFGRRVEENGSGGLDHGHGNVVLALGGGLNKGVHGTWPGLSASSLVDGDLAGTTDYRSIVSEVLTKRVGIGSTANIFPGYTPTAVGLA